MRDIMMTDSSTSIKFTFVIPAYNCAPYLRECVGSILRQSFTNFEIIIVEDGAKDDTGKVADELALHDSRISVIHKTNGGAGSARNIGVCKALGKYVIFIDGDDFWPNPNSLEELNQEIEKTPQCDFIGFNCSYYYPSHNKFQPWAKFDKYLTEPHASRDCIAKLVESGSWPISPCLKVIKTNYLRTNEIHFDERLHSSEDMPWSVELIQKANVIRFANLYVYAYRKEVKGSVSTTFSSSKFDELIKIMLNGVNSAMGDVAIMSFWAYEYCILLGQLTFFSSKERKSKYNQLKQYRYLLKYTLNPKVKKVALLSSFVGLKLTTMALGVFIKRMMTA